MSIFFLFSLQTTNSLSKKRQVPEISDRNEKRVPALDGLRGLAILLVALGHIFYSLYPFKFGWIGLNLFFVLSGYLITMRLFHHLKMDGRRYFQNFYARRVLRKYPFCLACLLVFFALLPLVYSRYFLYFSSVYEIQGWYWGYASNWYIFLFGLPKNPVFFHFWSLAVEEQFYLIWPFLFKYIVRFKYRLIVISLLLVLSVWSRNASSLLIGHITIP